MKTKRVEVQTTDVGPHTMVMEAEIDDDENILGIFLVIDGVTIAKRIEGDAGDWEVLVPGWVVRDGEDGDLHVKAPPEKSLH